MQTGALIAAAGRSGSMKEFRPMLRLNGTSLIQKEIDILRTAGISPIVVVTGHEAEMLEKHLAHRGVVCLRNEEYESGEMLDSVKLGLQWLREKCGAVLFLPADAPLFTVSTVEAILRAEEEIVIPVFEGQNGHPILIRRAVIPHILQYKGEFGLRGALAVSGARTGKVEVSDPGILMEVGNPEEYRQALAYERKSIEEKPLAYTVRIEMKKEDVFFDPETAAFLTLIDEKGSMLSACKEIGMSYSKGWKRIKHAEDQTGFPFLERRAGGTDGGNSRLTEKGRAFLEAYRKMAEDVERSAQAFFSLHFEVPGSGSHN